VWVRVTVGLFLLVTGTLKVHGLLVDPLKTELLGIPSWLQILAIQVEFLLALWLLSGLHSRWALMSATAFFAIAGGIAAKQVYENQQTCGCFGNFDVNPALTLGLDIIVLAMLAATLYWAPREQAGVSRSEWLGHIGAYLTILIALVALPGLLGWVDYADTVRTLRGEVLEVLPRVADLGATVAGLEKRKRIEVKNHGKTTVRIVGGSASCGCLVYDDLPLVIPPQPRPSAYRS
jgi:hypothetical protein